MPQQNFNPMFGPVGPVDVNKLKQIQQEKELDKILKANGVKSQDDELDEILKSNGVEIPKQDTFGSMAMQGLTGLKDFASQVLQSNIATPKGLANALSVGYGLVQPFTEFGQERKGGFPEQTGRFITGMAGTDYDTIDRLRNEGNYGALAGHLAIPGAMAFAPKVIGKMKGTPKPKGLPLPEVLPAETPKPTRLLTGRPSIIDGEIIGERQTPLLGPGPSKFPEIIDTDFVPGPENRLLGAGPEPVSDIASAIRQLSGRQEPRGLLPALGETTTGGDPRFFAGRAGIGDANRAYPFDTGSSLRGLRDEIVTDPFGVTHKQSPTMLPEEFGQVVDLGPEIANNLIGEPTLLDRAQYDPAFNALVPDRYKSGESFGVRQPIVGNERPSLFQQTMEHPEGGAIVNAPEQVRGILFSPNVLEPEFSSLFRQPEKTPSGGSLFRRDVIEPESASAFRPVVEPELVPEQVQSQSGLFRRETIEPRTADAFKKQKPVSDLPYDPNRFDQIPVEGNKVVPEQVKPVVKEKAKPVKGSPLLPDDLRNLEGGANPTEFFKMLKDNLSSFGAARRAPFTGRAISPELLTQPQGDIIKFLQNAKPLRAKQDIIRTQDTARKFASMDDIKSTGEQWAREMKGSMSGEVPKVGFEPIRNNFTPEQIAQFYDQINASLEDKGHKLTAIRGLDKILSETGSHIPQTGEMRILSKVFGKEFTDQIIELHAGLPLPILSRNMIMDVINVPKSAKTGLDVSAALRQGAPLMHMKAYRDNLVPYMKSFASKAQAEAYDLQMKSDPFYEVVDPHNGKLDIGLTEISDNRPENLLRREEQFASKLAHKLPWVPPSERSFNVFMNRLRFDAWKEIRQQAVDAGVELTPEKHKEIAKFIRNATGRGDLGRAAAIAPELNALFFSPKFVASRLHMINPVNYIKADPFVRKHYLKSAASMVTLATTVTVLSKLFAGDDEAKFGTDVLSTELGKTKIGNTRIDPWAGLQQPVVRGLQSAPDKFRQALVDNLGAKDADYDNALSSGPWGPLGRFVRSKLSPTAAFLYDWKEGKDFLGKPFKMDARIADLFIPMSVNDTYELMKDDPKLAPLIPLMFSGMGVTTFNQEGIAEDAMRWMGRR